MRNYNWDKKEERSLEAIQHTDVMASKYKDDINKCIVTTKVYSEDFNSQQHVDNNPIIKLVDLDSVSAAVKYKDGITAILNFASHKNPGGKFIEGSSAQEEALCHKSFLYNILSEFNDSYYEYNRNHLNKGLYVNRGLYTKNVLFQNNNDSDYFDVITCACPNVRAATKYKMVSKEENSKVLKDRIRFILDIAEDNNCNTLILGAYGCGVFGQDAEEVAKYFIDELKERPFKTVVFAIPDKTSDNYKKFNKLLKSC